MRAITTLLLLTLGLAPVTAVAQDQAWKQSASADQLELVPLMKEYLAAIPQGPGQWDPSTDPSSEYLPKLLAFEEEHRGTDSGLLALRQIVPRTWRLPEETRSSTRKEAFERLKHYANNPLTAVIVRSVGNGNPDPEGVAGLRMLMKHPDTSPLVAGYCQLSLGRHLTMRKYGFDNGRKRLAEIEAGAKSEVGEKDFRLERMKHYPDKATCIAGEAEGIELLDLLAQSKSTIRMRVIRPIDENGILIKLDKSDSASASLSEEAAGYHFQATRLRPGKPAPELGVALIDGKQWSLADQTAAGRVTLIHFSFKGCGPCEAMYPDLRKMQEQYGDKLAILAIMVDPDLNDTVEAAESGKISWSVTWDGRNGPLATKWGILGYPTTWVIDQDGKIAESYLFGDQLTDLVGELITQPANDK
ncbi:TlpA family protein disulfide reductase [Blastopirellula marina]|nr:TlpA disulfide reductase family protein [Blastopirellula marina]